MELQTPSRLFMATITAAALLTACGGGGGGGSEGPSQASSNVTLRSSGGLYAANVVVGTTLPAQMVSGSASGDPGSLNGRTIYVVVEDPIGLFAPTGHTVAVDAATGNFFVTLQGKIVTFVGRRTGTFQVKACLDPQCATQLGGSPLSYPYEVVSAEPLAITVGERVRVTRRFGESGIATTAVITSFPPNATFSSERAPFYPFSLDQTFEFVHTLIDFDGSLNAVAGVHSGSLRLRPAAPGTYVSNIRIRASVPGKQGLPFTQEKTVQVEYEVVDDPSVTAAFYPQSIEIDARGFGCQDDPPIRFLALTRPDDRIEISRFEYVSEPTAAASHPFSTNWLEAIPSSITPRLKSCVGGSVSGPTALPAGDYVARVVYRVTKDTGASAEVSIPFRYLR